MAQTDKNIVITPNIGQTADPKVAYSGANASVGAQTITLYVYPDNSGTLSWEGSAGQLMSVTNTLTGTIFAVNDVSGIPSITVQDTGQVTLAPYTGNLVIGTTTDAGTAKVQVTGAVLVSSNITGGNLLTSGLVSATGTIRSNNLLVQGDGTNGYIRPTNASSVLYLGANNTNYVTIASNGIVTNTQNFVAQSTGPTTTGQFAATSGTTFVSLYNDGTNAYILKSGTSATAFDTTRPFYVNLSTGAVTLDGTGAGISCGGSVTLKGIFNGNANGVGNIGSSGTYFNTVFAKATSAQYADVAEKYLADTQFAPGTVLEIGGSAEVTATTGYASTRIAGVVSTNPAFIMNSSETSENSVELALLGRIPCRVVGKIERGDMLCSSRIAGVATALNENLYKPGAVIGKALESYNSVSEGVIEILVGRL